MQHFTDQMGRAVALPVHPPRRIISLVPSQTELLADLGLAEEVVGITKFCTHPEQWFRTKKRVGGTKTVSLEKVAALAPDLILGNKEENDREQIEALAEQFPVWMSAVYTLADALEMIQAVGVLTGATTRANALAQQIQLEFDQNIPTISDVRPRVAYFIWRKPYMVVGRDTFIHSMLERAGFENVFQGLSRYPEIALEALRVARPELIFLSSEPFPFKEKHMDPFKEVCPTATIQIVDGALFSWYGSRLLQAPGYFKMLQEKM
ncbi:MAG: ABC transporter substrate-binding protein [Lewinellaceae bacterium]|nr:ABC transporter substrate-binding protein [Lewinellaceae bacterium]